MQADHSHPVGMAAGAVLVVVAGPEVTEAVAVTEGTEEMELAVETADTGAMEGTVEMERILLSYGRGIQTSATC